MSNIRITSRGGEKGRRQHAEILVEDSEMIPKSRKSSDSRKAVGIHEFAALARSSLYGISQAVKEHVTKPTSLAQGRVAHLIEWKGWPKTSDTSSDPLNSHFSSYCHLTEGEQEARFAAGVAEQFAIAEAKLRAWASVDDDDEEEEDDSTDEDFSQSNGHTSTCPTQSSDTATSTPVSQVPCQVEIDSNEAPPSPGPTNPGGSSRSSLSSDRPTSQTDAHMSQRDPPHSPSYRMGSFLKEGGLEGGKEQVVPLQEDGAGVCVIHKPDWRSSFRSSRFDSCYSTSHSESPGEEEEEEEEDSVFQDGKVWHSGQGSFFSDCASSGVGSLDEEVEIEEGDERRGNKEHLI